MLAIDLTKTVPDFFYYYVKLSQLKVNEFCFIKLKKIDVLSAEETKIIHTAVRFSSKVALSVSFEDVSSRDITQIFESFKFHTLCVRVKTNPDKFGTVYNFGVQKSGDRDICEVIQKKLSECPFGKEIALEFEDEEDFRVVGSTLAAAHEYGVSWAIVNTGIELNENSVTKFKELFDFLRMRRCYKLNVYFDFFAKDRAKWQLQTMNTFSGLRHVHIDISNKCTHSCVFCGLYSPHSQKHFKDQSNEVATQEVRDFMKMEIDGDHALRIIRDLPFDVEIVQLGGAGDPLMHPMALDIMMAVRERGFRVEVLSNMEYLDEAQIKTIASLGEGTLFIVNLSGGTLETYLKTRPKQTEKVFNKITENLKLFSKLKKDNANKGAFLNLMCVVSKKNSDKLLEIAEYAVKVGADSVWFKAMEVHADHMKELVPDESDLVILKSQLKESLSYLDANGILIFKREECEKIIGTDSEIKVVERVDLRNEIDLGVVNGSVTTDFYAQNPCTIGYSYIRFEVDGKIRPCCIAKYEIGHLNDGDWRVSWHSTAWNVFRKKTARIHLEKFHLNNNDWLFCQQCSHLPINQENVLALK